MNFVILAASVPGPVEFGTVGWLTRVAAVAALAPLWLVARQALNAGVVPIRAVSPTRSLRTIEGGKEARRRAA
jgi:hypothetical protein